jgi:hypothetical protein
MGPLSYIAILIQLALERPGNPPGFIQKEIPNHYGSYPPLIGPATAGTDNVAIRHFPTQFLSPTQD